MNGATLKALRCLLFYTQSEAAAHIGGVTLRSWQYWESNSSPIPVEVIEKIYGIIQWRRQMVDEASRTLANPSIKTAGTGSVGQSMVLTYGSEIDWVSLPGRLPSLWKPHCSVVAELIANYGCHTVVFDLFAYHRWRGKRLDSESMRTAWAKLQ